MIPRTQLMCLTVLLCLGGAALAQPQTNPRVVVFADGRPRVYLALSSADDARLSNPQPATGNAVADLLRCFSLLTGQELPKEPAEGLIPLRLKLLDKAEDAAHAQPLGHQGYLLRVTPEEILLAAPTRMGVFNAIYDVLDRWGCRWIMPGSRGEIIPRVDRLELAVEDLRWNQSMDGRVEAGQSIEFVLWRARNRMGMEEWLTATHAFHLHLPPKEYFATHPDYYAMIGGRRVPQQLETANPEVIDLLRQKARAWFQSRPGVASFPLDWEDMPTFSTSPESLALDPPNNPRFFGLPSMTDRAVRLANTIAESLEAEFPGRKVAFYGYNHHTLPPVAVKPHKNVAVGLTRMGFSFVHLTPHEKNPSSVAWWKLLEDWLKICDYVFTYDYDPIPWTGGLISPVYLERAEALKKMHALGVKGNYSDKAGGRRDAADYVSQYLEWRIKADSRRDPRQELRQMCEVFFGPAAEPIHRYYLALAKVTNTNYPAHGFTNTTALAFDELFTPEIIKEARHHLEAAVAAAAADAVIRERVEMVRVNFQYLDRFLEGMWAAKARDERRFNDGFAAAAALIDKLHALDPNYIDQSDAQRRLEAIRLHLAARNFPQSMGMVRQWTLLGPVPDPMADFDVADEMFPANRFGKPVQVGKATILKDGKPMAWRAYNSPGGLIDFTEAFRIPAGSNQPVATAYAAVVIEAPQAMAAQFRTDSFFPFRIYLNGQQVYHRPDWDSPAPDKRIVPVQLPAGRSQVVLRVSQICSADLASPWGFYFRVTDLQGNPIPELKIAPTPVDPR